MNGQAASIPVGVFLLRGRLFAFRRRNLAFDVEGDAVGARHTETGGIAAHLGDASEESLRVRQGVCSSGPFARGMSVVGGQHGSVKGERVGLTSQALEARCLRWSRQSWVQRLYRCLASHTSGNSWQTLLAGSCPSGSLVAEHAGVWCVAWVAAAGLVLVAAEVVERTLRRWRDGRPWEYRYTSLVALFMSTRLACRLWRVSRSL